MRARAFAVAASGTLVAAAACGGGGGGASGVPAGAPRTGVPAPAVAPNPTARLALRAVRVRGTELRYVETGSGIPVVLVHGSLGSLASWQPQIAAFAARFRVIVYSRRYHPPNVAQPDGQRYTLALHTDDLIGLIEALGLERVHLVGSSYGAYVALAVALQRPDLVRSLVLVEPPIVPWLSRTPAGDSLRRGFEETTLPAVRRALARGDSVEAVRRFWDGLQGGSGRFDALPEPTRAALVHAAFELRLEMSADAPLYMPALACADVGRIRNSVLVINGERGSRMFRVITDELTRCLPTAEVATIPGAGHSAPAENPAAFDAVVLAFLMRN